MSIVSQLLRKKITFTQAATQAASWVSNTLGSSPAGAATLSDLKQAASNAVDLGNSIAGDAVATGTEAVEAAVDALLVKVLGPAASVPSLASHMVIDSLAALLKAAVDAKALEAKANLNAPKAPIQGSGGPLSK